MGTWRSARPVPPPAHRVQNAQPTFARWPGAVALAHNGNLTNTRSCGTPSRTTRPTVSSRAAAEAIDRPTTPR